MNQLAVVPHRQLERLVRDLDAEALLRHVALDQLRQFQALARRHADDAVREGLGDEDRVSSRLRVSRDDRVDDVGDDVVLFFHGEFHSRRLGHGLFGIWRRLPVLRAVAVRLARGVVRVEREQQRLHRGAQRGPGRLRLGELRVVRAHGCHLGRRAEERERRRQRLERVVRVPLLAENNRDAALPHDLEDLRAAGQALGDHVPLDIAEPRRERDVLRRRQVALVREREHAPRVLDDGPDRRDRLLRPRRGAA
mmetsp:Transcript_864/g.2636  ORF Transcript_864/g.2636 Transcript_864/m.2636 type:complete len:252 (-) Transcript_864:314-1069(-)